MKQLCVAIDPLDAPDDMLSAVRRSLSEMPVEWFVQRSLEERAPAAVTLWLVTQSSWRKACTALSEARIAQPMTAHVILADDLVPAQAVEQLMAHGALDFMRYPASEAEIALRIKRALGAVPAPDEPVFPPLTVVDGLPLKTLMGRCPAFLRQARRLGVIAGTDAGVLILGEPGTGKKAFAQAIHAASPRAAGPWVAVNCGSVPATALAEDLFGPGSEDSAPDRGVLGGRVGEAQGGTLFLEDVDAMPWPVQTRLWRFLTGATHALRQGGGMRVIAASHRALDQAVAEGWFSPDLFSWLNVLSLHLPALRDRREDIPALALHFFNQANETGPRRAGGISPLALRRLMAHAWPGNVRELKQVIHRAVLLSESPSLQAEDIEFDGDSDVASGLTDESFQAAKARVVEQFERNYIERLLQASEGNISHAARIAKKNRRAFFELLRKHDIDADRFRMSVV